MLLADSHGVLMHANKHWAELTGYDMREIEGTTASILYGPLSNNIEDEELMLKLQRGNSVRIKNSFYYRKNGTTFYNDVAWVPIKNHVSEITHYCAYMQART